MKNILFLITKSEIGGAQKWVKEQVVICSSRFNCFMATNSNGWLIEDFNPDKVLVDNGIESRFSLIYLNNLAQFVKRHKIDLIVASSANAGLYARMMKLILSKRIKIIYVSHGWSALYNSVRLKFFYIMVERLLSFLSDSIICVSENDFKKAISEIGISRKKLALIRNSILPIKYDQASKSNHKIKILSVGRFSKPKRFDLLVESVKNCDVELHLIGSGPQMDTIKKIAPDNVRFHGEIKNFNNFIDYDIFCLISDSEGLPLAAIEAMSCGLPLVLSNVGGCAELINGNGFLTHNDPIDIKKSISLVLTNRNALGKQSLSVFQDGFNLSLKQHEYIEFYNKYL